MKLYIKRLFLFIIPLLIISSPFIFQYILFKVSEENTYEFKRDIKNRRNIVGYKYDNFKDIYYKYEILTKENFDIIGIGSSRVLQFRENFFNRKFYAWNIINYSSDYLSVFETLKSNGKLPSVFLLQLDERTFNKDFDNPKPTLARLKYPNTINIDLDITKNIIKDFFSLKRKTSVQDYLLHGLSAQYYFSGYRHDGSYLYGKLCYDIVYNHDNFDSTFEVQQSKIDSSNTFFNITYNPAALQNLKLFLEACTSDNIKVICFFQPYPDSIIKDLKEKSFYSNIKYVHKQVENLVMNSKHLYLNSELLPTDNNLNLDGIHPTEKSNLNLLQLIPKGTEYRAILNESLLEKSSPYASNSCIDSNELSTIKKFFELTKNY